MEPERNHRTLKWFVPADRAPYFARFPLPQEFDEADYMALSPGLLVMYLPSDSGQPNRYLQQYRPHPVADIVGTAIFLGNDEEGEEEDVSENLPVVLWSLLEKDLVQRGKFIADFQNFGLA
jgi:hypothetical protein